MIKSVWEVRDPTKEIGKEALSQSHELCAISFEN